MHMFSPELGFWGGHGIVGGQIPLGAGLALRINTKKKRMLRSPTWVMAQ